MLVFGSFWNFSAYSLVARASSIRRSEWVDIADLSTLMITSSSLTLQVPANGRQLPEGLEKFFREHSGVVIQLLTVMMAKVTIQ